MKRPPKARILIVDDHLEMARVLAEQLADHGYAVDLADSGRRALEMARTVLPDLVITDLRMEKVDGFDVLDGMKELDPGMPVLLMTAFGAIETAIEAIKRGAYHYFTKPFSLDEVLVFVERALADRKLRDEHRAFQKLAQDRSSFGALLGRSAAMRRLYDLIERVALSPASVLIRGESGTGKELVARALHFHGPRSERPFVAVNCTALPESLLESELFGHVRGAFTGATTTRRGLFLEAEGGTLFLDEIGDMPPSLQAKLLRAIEEGEIRSVGSDATRKVDVRIVAATHQDLEERVRTGQFRADLFYRLNVVSLHVPPLRERAEDIPLLVERFLARARERNPSARVTAFAPELLAALCASSWPGNVRELENVVERLVVVSTKSIADLADLEAHAPHVIAATTPTLAFATKKLVTLRQLEDEYIRWVLEKCGGSKAKAAEILGIDVSTLYRRERDRGASP